MVFALVFDTVSGGEWLVLLAVVLIVVGPKNLPAMARKTGSVLAQLRRAADEFKRQLMTMDQDFRQTVNSAIDIPDESPESGSGDSDPDSVEPPGDGDSYAGENQDYADMYTGQEPYPDADGVYAPDQPATAEEAADLPATAEEVADATEGGAQDEDTPSHVRS